MIVSKRCDQRSTNRIIKKGPILRIKKKWSLPEGNIYLIYAISQYHLSMSMLRLQEFFESPCPDFKNKLFTIEQYMDWYATMNGDFTYHQDWGGFNVPGEQAVEFFSMYKRHNLMKKEKVLYDLLKPMIRSYKRNGTKFTIIGIYRNDEMDHELAHAFYSICPEYKKEMDKLSNKVKYLEDFFKLIKDVGYTSSQNYDEVQAYLSTSTKKDLMDLLNFNSKWSIPHEMKRFFKGYKRRFINEQ